MKRAGVVRRIDDLGRIVIPKEIRKTLRIKEGDPLLITLELLGKVEMYIEQIKENARLARMLYKKISVIAYNEYIKKDSKCYLFLTLCLQTKIRMI